MENWHIGSILHPSRVIVCSGIPKDGFLLNALKTLFRQPRVLLDLYRNTY